VDSGVDNRHKAFRKAGHFDDDGPCVPSNIRFVTGYDATVANNSIIGCTSRDYSGHGTHIAGIALGLPTSQPHPAACLALLAPDDVIPIECGGVAPGAGLVDVKVCAKNRMGNPCPYLLQGLEWIQEHWQEHNIRVVNISLANQCVDDDGKSAVPLK